MMIYFIIFARICQSIMTQLFFDDQETGNFFQSKTFWVLILALLMLPLVIKKELKELKIASVILFVGIFAFIFIFIGQLLFEAEKENPDQTYKLYYTFDLELDSVKGISIIILAFSF